MNKEFKVIKIIDDKSLIVNAGSLNNVEKGDIMIIHGKSEPIFDLDTNENLGQINIMKARLKVSEVYDKMCLCEAPFVSSYLLSLTTNSLFSSSQDVLNVDPTEVSGSGDKTIRLGDFAKLVKHQENNEKDNTAEDYEENII